MAARRHWRFIVRDQYGYAIQNALVYVYQPGTTTAFTGTAYNAASGGSPVTNPFTTNAQGEVEGWFDTAQVVDVLVTDNTNAAYRAVGGASDTVDFSSFTEKDDIYAAASDTPLEKGTTADLADITPGAQSEVLGSSNRWADGAHVHGHTAFADNPHGASQHTDITRSLWLPSQTAFAQTGAAETTLGTEPDSVRYLAFLDAATNSAVWNFEVPSDWASGVLTATPYWIPISTDGVAHTVRWSYVAKKRAAGDDVTAAGTTTTWTGASAARTANLLVLDTATSLGITPAAAGELVQFTLRRIGADAADTYVGTVGVVGVRITYTANQ